ncbi:recombinase family protein [Sphingomonas montanisoli]|uniref:Recombinase family protein n=1 Tax=Sphingomonas montanisoli TaxID=2606412 RepID=A0A5D9C6T9_9SPHN|nr:recombinase family protein [Sphingomonas montanisoli]TZG25715.1 recombinase family protein [Sphingomonas montanisoli]
MAKRGPRSAPATSSDVGVRRVRCAVYTRKSTEEGLDQSFNSLDAQREACEAFITSQRHEGWVLDPALYDDGGYSGGTMERPALKRLLADIESGRVDIIVVYKVDRLTRALSDFAKIVEILDAKGASFVSVTQAFNTTTSMGRLTLNVLLSFAQFEREVTGERIRDKIAASKKKGMYMGGLAPLGYDASDRQLLIKETEAATVRLIYQRHVELGSITALIRDLNRRHVVTKTSAMRDGRMRGGQPFTRGALIYLLRNPIYIGRVRHGDMTYDGEHQAIVPLDLWEASQALLSGAKHQPRPRKTLVSPLNGRIEDGVGRPMMSVHSNHGTRRYRYYASRYREGQAESVWRIPAGDVEEIVQKGLFDFLGDQHRLGAELGTGHSSVGNASFLITDSSEPLAFAALLEMLDAQIFVQQQLVTIEFSAMRLAKQVGADASGLTDDEQIRVEVAVSLKRRGHELRLVYAAPEARPAQRDDRLIQLLASGRSVWAELQKGKGGASRSHMIRMARLNFLAPDIVTAILEGRQPVEMTTRSLLRVAELPIAWPEQRKALGFT